MMPITTSSSTSVNAARFCLLTAGNSIGINGSRVRWVIASNSMGSLAEARPMGHHAERLWDGFASSQVFSSQVQIR